MMHVLPCARVREDLAEYHDGELPIDTQILVQSHLQECVSCRLEAGALADLGDALRTMAGSIPGRSAAETGRISGAVLERVRVEHELSIRAQVRALFEDMHLIWAGLGASAAMLFCIFASAGVLHAASQERPGSLAGLISTIASTSSNDAVRLAGTLLENGRLLDTAVMQATGDEGDLMLSAMLTRDGRIQNLQVLEEQARALRVKPEIVLAMLDAASRARFEPVMSGDGLPLAVKVVWLVTSTTVKGRADYDLYLVSPPLRTQPTNGPAATPKTQPPPLKSASAGDDGVAAA